MELHPKWVNHSCFKKLEAYHKVVRTTWKKDYESFYESLNNFMQDSLVFNKDIFGNIFRRKMEYDDFSASVPIMS